MRIARRAAPERVLLVHPGIYADRNPLVFPPWGALMLGAELLGRGHEVEVLDLNGQDVAAAVPAALGRHRPTVVGITCKLGLGAARFRAVVDVVRRESPDTTVVAGGPLVSSFPDPAHPLWAGLDAVFWGDGETALADWLATDERPGGVLGPAETPDLDRIGVPAWWGPLRDYVKPAELWPNMTVDAMHVASARGCTRRCTFCYLNAQYPGSRFRYVSADRLMADLQRLHDTAGASGFYFVDDCFVDRPETRVRRFCDLNIAEGAPFEYGCDVQLTDLENPALLRRMHGAGFRALYVGIETASPAVRKSLGKGSVRTGVPDLVSRALDLGLVVRASIGIGWPGETARDVAATLEMIDRTPGLVFDAYRYLPLPNTPLGERSEWTERRAAAGPGRLEHAYEDYSEYNTNHSDIPAEQFDALWQELLARERQRLEMYFARP
ncbi:B12-binding domain-containing radical SAM protein [Dactylosporangium sp. CA-092794]|uniref:B12-binding domain-containing radical SAM protein n=1 Tax=Dactylosporangium sp. CA-092794 TaxID=3239929 RepID=UPI003D937D4E